MKKSRHLGTWELLLLIAALCIVATACGGAADESMDEPIAQEPAEEAPAMEEPAEIAEAIAPEDSGPLAEDAPVELDVAPTESAAEQPTPTALPMDVAPEPDFGAIAYDVPQHMVRSEEVQVILLVSPSEEDDLRAALVEELEEVGQDADNVQTARVEVAKRMSASLTSAPADAFEIVPLQAADEQLIRDDEPTQWEWTVVPLKGGTHRLILRIDRLVERDGIIEPLKEEVHRDDVTVEVPVGLKLQDAWGGFDLKWLAGVLIFPLFFYILNRRDKKRDQTG